MLTPTTVSVYTLTQGVDGVQDRDGKTFDAHAYSLMKHGHTESIERLGDLLAQELLATPSLPLRDPAPVLLPVAYLHVPPTCFHLAQRIAGHITAARALLGLAPARVVKIAKDAVTATDYAASSAAERQAEMATIGFRLDESVDGAHLVLIDDVRVTGLAEAAAMSVLQGRGAASLTLGYLALVDGTLAHDPAIEARLNHAAVHGINDMAEAARAGQMLLTIRFLKRFLAAPPAERAQFLHRCPGALVQEMLDGAHATGPAFVASYADAVRDLQERASHALSV